MEIFSFEPYTLRFFERHCELAEDWAVTVLGRRYQLRAGMDTDGISWPQFLMGITGDRFNPEILPIALWHDCMYRDRTVGRLHADLVFGFVVFYRAVVVGGMRFFFWMGGGAGWRWLLLPIAGLRLCWRATVALLMTLALVCWGWLHWHGPRRWSARGVIVSGGGAPKIGEQDG